MELSFSRIKKFIPVLLILAFVLIVFYLVLPTYHKINNLRSLAKTKQAELQNQEEQLRLFEELHESSDLKKLDKILPDNSEIPELMIQIEALASQNNLILKSINFTEIQGEITAQTSLIGTYSALKKYLQALENNLRLIDVVSLSFQTPKQGSYYDFNLIIKTYYGSGQGESKALDNNF